MNILVTGHDGFIGRNIVPSLEAEGHIVSLFEWGSEFPDLYACDIQQVIHLGAISSTTEKNVEKIMTQNYQFSVDLLCLCETLGIDFQYSSSASVYGLNKVFTETSPVDPRTPYSWSKYMFERYVQSRNRDIKVQGFRYFNVHGPHEEHKGTQASPHHQFTKQAKETGIIKVFENSNNYFRDFVPVSSVVDAHKQFLTVDNSGLWNVGTGTATSFQQIANDISDEFKATITYIPMPDNLKHSYQTYTCADTTNFNKAYANV